MTSVAIIISLSTIFANISSKIYFFVHFQTQVTQVHFTQRYVLHTKRTKHEFHGTKYEFNFHVTQRYVTLLSMKSLIWK